MKKLIFFSITNLFLKNQKGTYRIFEEKIFLNINISFNNFYFINILVHFKFEFPSYLHRNREERLKESDWNIY